MSDLEALEAVAALGFTTDNIEDSINELGKLVRGQRKYSRGAYLGTLSVVTLGPVVASTALAEDEVVRAEECTERTSADSIHGAWLQVDEDRTRNIFVARCL